MLAGGCNWHRACPQCVDPGAQWQKQPPGPSRLAQLVDRYWPDQENLDDWLLVAALLLIGGVWGFVLGIGP